MVWTGLTVVTLGLASYVAVRWAVWSAIHQQLVSAGFPSARFRLGDLTIHRLSLLDLELVPTTDATTGEGPRAAKVEAVYTLSQLRRKQVSSVSIDGVTATVDVSSGEPKLAGWPVGERAGGDASTGTASIQLPQIRLRSSTLRLKGIGTTDLLIPVEGSYTPTTKGGEAAGVLGIAGTPVNVSAVVGQGASTFALTADTKLELGTLPSMLPPGTWPAGVFVHGSATVQARYDSAQHLALSVTLDQGQVATLLGSGVVLDRLTLTAKADHEPAGANAVIQFDGELTTRLFDETARLTGNVQIDSLSPVAGSVRVALRGNKGLSALAINAKQLKWDAATGLSGSATLGCVLPFTSAIRSALSDAGIRVEKPEPVIAQGTVTFSTSPTLLVTARLSDLSASAGSIVVAGSELKGVSARADAASVVMTADQLSLVVDGLTAGVGEAVSGGARLARTAQGGEPSLVLSTPSLAADYRPGTGQVTAASQAMVLAINPSDLAFGVATVTGMRGRVQLDAESDGSGLVLNLSDAKESASQLSFDSAEFKTAGWKAGPGSVSLMPATPWQGAAAAGPATLPATEPVGPAAAPLLAAAAPLLAEAAPLLAIVPGQAPALSFRYASKDLTLSGSGLVNNVGDMGGVVHLSLPANAPPGLDGYAALNHMTVTHEASGLVLQDASLRLPVNLDATTPREGSLHVASVLRNGTSVKGDISARMFVTRSRLWADVTWPLLSEGTVKASADFYFLPQASYGIAGTVKAWVPPFEFTRAAELRALLPPSVADADVAGKFDAEVGYSLSIDGNEQRWGTVNVTDASLSSRTLDADLSGVTGTVSLRSFDPLESHPGQRLSVSSARLGSYQVRNGSGRFRLDPGGIIFVEDAAFAFAGGEVSARGFRVQPSRQAVDLTLYADKLDLGALASLASGGRVSGSGRMFARLPVSVVWPDVIRLGSGYLYAEGGDGRISLGVNAEDVGRLLGASVQDPSGAGGGTGGGGGNQQLLQQRITGALTSFGYSDLAVTFTRDDHASDPARALTASVRFAGKGPESAGGQVLDLTFNFTGVEDLLSAALLVKRSGAGVGGGGSGGSGGSGGGEKPR